MKEEQKIYIKGNLERGSEVIKILTDLGGRNTYSYAGDSFDSYYFINPCGIISVSDFNSEVFSFVKEFYKEIDLPKWKPKNEECYKAPWKHKYFEPFQKVLIPGIIGNVHYWFANLYSHYNKKYKVHVLIDSETINNDDYILPYEGNEDKLGKPVE